MKFSYICVTDVKDEDGVVASEKFVSGLQKITA